MIEKDFLKNFEQRMKFVREVCVALQQQLWKAAVEGLRHRDAG